MASKTAVGNPESLVKVTSANPFLETIQNRRSIYALNKSPTISDERIQEIVKHVLLHVPSSFNSQPVRIVLLLKDEHDKLWNEIAKDALRAIVPAEQFPTTEKKLDGFAAGYGTALFFTDRASVQKMQQTYAIYAQNFPIWAAESNGMHQFALWTALEAEGLGANLQHYHPLIDQKVHSTWNINEDWELRAQLVFGGVSAKAGEKTYQPLEGERLFVHGA